MKKTPHPVHSGKIFPEKFLKKVNLCRNSLSSDTGVPARRKNETVPGKRSISADAALRLTRFFGMSAEFRPGLQARYNLDITVGALGKQLEREVK